MTLKDLFFMDEAQDYKAMFQSLIQKKPELEKEVDETINKAKANLKKLDRITWYLRQYRIALSKKYDNDLYSQYLQDLKKRNPDYVESDNISMLLDKLINSLAHNIPAIMDYSFQNQSPKQVEETFVNILREEVPALKGAVQYEVNSDNKIVMDFNDGWYWVQLNRAQCREEGAAMGHCGNDANPKPGSTILSLRKLIKRTNNEKNWVWEPHLTFILLKDGMLSEMKGRNNEKPNEKYHKYIIPLLKETKLIRGIEGGGYLVQNNFSIDDLTKEEREELIKINPRLGDDRANKAKEIQEVLGREWDVEYDEDYGLRISAVGVNFSLQHLYDSDDVVLYDNIDRCVDYLSDETEPKDMRFVDYFKVQDIIPFISEENLKQLEALKTKEYGNLANFINDRMFDIVNNARKLSQESYFEYIKQYLPHSLESNHKFSAYIDEHLFVELILDFKEDNEIIRNILDNGDYHGLSKVDELAWKWVGPEYKLSLDKDEFNETIKISIERYTKTNNRLKENRMTLKDLFFMDEAQDYKAMFQALIQKKPELEKTVDAYITQAKTMLKKLDRITWFLKQARLLIAHNTDKTLFDQYLADIKKRNPQFKQTSRIDDLLQELAHFVSMNIPEIERYSFVNQSPDKVLEDLEDLEKTYSDKAVEGTIPYKEDMIDKQVKVVKDFGDGYYWVDLNRSSCRLEGGAMGHCGNTASAKSDDTILSLRKLIKRGKDQNSWLWEPHLTFILDGEGKLGEMKGKNNEKPDEKYHRYIIELLRNTKLVKGIKGGGYAPENNFDIEDLSSSEKEQLLKINPALERPKYAYLEDLRNSMSDDWDIEINDKIGRITFTTSDRDLIEDTILNTFYGRRNGVNKDLLKSIFEGDYYYHFSANNHLKDVWDDIDEDNMDKIKKLAEKEGWDEEETELIDFVEEEMSDLSYDIVSSANDASTHKMVDKYRDEIVNSVNHKGIFHLRDDFEYLKIDLMADEYEDELKEMINGYYEGVFHSDNGQFYWEWRGGDIDGGYDDEYFNELLSNEL